MRRHAGLILLVLAVVTLGAYGPVLHHEFVNYDDPDYVTANPHVQAGLTAANVKWAFTTGHASNWHPLTWLSHMVDWQWFGANPAGHHFTSLLFHTLNSLLVFWVLLQITGAIWRSAFVAAVFAWHPLHVESVAWISERKDVLSTLFWLLTMWAYAIYVRESWMLPEKKTGQDRRPVGGAWVFYVLALLAFALGLMAKPMLVTLPFVLLLLDYWPFGRTAFWQPTDEPRESGTKSSPRLPPPSPRRLILEKVPFLLLGAASSVVTFLVQRRGGAVSSLRGLPFGERVANAFVSYLRYAGKLFWPENLSVLYPHPGHWPGWLVTVACLFVLGGSTGVVLAARRGPYLVTGWFWFLGTLVPVIGLVQVGVQSMADRYTYVPVLGLCLMLAWGVPEALAAWRHGATVSAWCGGVFLALCVPLTRSQVAYWKTSFTLFQHAVAVTDGNYLAYNNLGFFFDREGNLEAAKTNYQKSLEINPNYEEAQNNMGFVLANQGHDAEALPYYEAALRIKPGLVEAHNNLGNALANLGRLDEAVTHYKKALELNPEHADAHGNYGVALAMQGRLDEAVGQLKESVRLRPNHASTHSNLGNALALQHKLSEAAQQYELALKLQPNDHQIHNNLGNILAEQGRLDDAVVQYNFALKLKAANPEAHFNLGMTLLRQGRRDEALTHFKEALRLRPGYGDAQKQINLMEGR